MIPVQVALFPNRTNNLIPLRENITFTCTGFESILFSFLVRTNDRVFTSLTQRDVELLREREIFTEVRSGSLTVVATEENNGTIVQCRDAASDPPLLSNNSTVTVIGKYIV